MQSNTTRTVTHAKPEKPAKSTTATKTQANGEAKSNLRSTQMTEYFPIRRSERKPKTTLLQERQKAIEERIISGSEEGLTVRLLVSELIGLGKFIFIFPRYSRSCLKI